MKKQLFQMLGIFLITLVPVSFIVFDNPGLIRQYNVFGVLINKPRCEKDGKHSYLLTKGKYWTCEEILDDHGKICNGRGDCRGKCVNGRCSKYRGWDDCYINIKNPIIPEDTQDEENGSVYVHICPPDTVR